MSIATSLCKKPLAANGVYTQDSRDSLQDNCPVGMVSGLVYSDKAGTLYFEESNDNSNWTQTITLTVSAGALNKFDLTAITKRWYRFRYVNGATSQTEFLLIQITGRNNIGKITLENSSVGLENNTVAEQLTQADAVADVLTFSDTISAIEIYHEETTSQIFVVNGLSLSIAAYGWRSPVGGTPAATVTIPNGINCVVTRLV